MERVYNNYIKMKTIIYSANIGDYDYFYHPTIIDPNVEYILFTDNKYITSKVWKIININNLNLPNLDNRKIARYIKINSHLVLPSHDASIWIDHCFKSKINNCNKIFQDLQFDKKNIMIYKHSWRSCIYKEADECIKLKLDNPKTIQAQMNRYRQKLYPDNNGLFETGFMLRKNNKIVQSFNELWWNELLNGSGRDQLSQCFAAWSLNLEIHPICTGQSAYNTPYLEAKTKHIKSFKHE